MTASRSRARTMIPPGRPSLTPSQSKTQSRRGRQSHRRRRQRGHDVDGAARAGGPPQRPGCSSGAAIPLSASLSAPITLPAHCSGSLCAVSITGARQPGTGPSSGHQDQPTGLLPVASRCPVPTSPSQPDSSRRQVERDELQQVPSRRTSLPGRWGPDADHPAAHSRTEDPLRGPGITGARCRPSAQGALDGTGPARPGAHSTGLDSPRLGRAREVSAFRPVSSWACGGPSGMAPGSSH